MPVSAGVLFKKYLISNQHRLCSVYYVIDHRDVTQIICVSDRDAT